MQSSAPRTPPPCSFEPTRSPPDQLQHRVHILIKVVAVAPQALGPACTLVVHPTHTVARLVQSLHPAACRDGRGQGRGEGNVSLSALLHAHVRDLLLRTGGEHVHGW